MSTSRLATVLGRQSSDERKPLREAIGSGLLAVAEVADVAKNIASIANIELACYIDERVAEANQESVKNQAKLNALKSEVSSNGNA